MSDAILLYQDALARLKAQRRRLSVRDEELLKEIQSVLQQIAKVDDQIYLMENQIDKVRAFDKIHSPMEQSDHAWKLSKILSEIWK